MAGANPGIWTDIYLTNAESIADQIDDAVRRAAGGGRRAAGRRRRRRSSAWNDGALGDRRRLLEADLAGAPVHELRLPVPNRPGIVAQVALALGKAGVNIADMALRRHPTCARGR